MSLQSDPAHCGKCANACKVGQACYKGACWSVCSTGLTYCSGKCVNVSTDDTNCGACGTACKTTEKCSAGKCVPKAKCGDNKVNTSKEKCDGSDLASKTCASFLGAGATGTLTCKSDCSGFVTTGCKKCERVRLYRSNNCGGDSLPSNVNLNFCGASYPKGGSLNDNVASIRVAAGIKARLLLHCDSSSSTMGTYDNTAGTASKCYNNPNRSNTSYVILTGNCK